LLILINFVSCYLLSLFMNRCHTAFTKRLIYLSIFSTLIFLTSLNAEAQTVKQWDRTFGGNNFEELCALQQTSDGGYILGGSSDSDAGGDKSQDAKGKNDYWVIKLDGGGNLIWEKTIGGVGDDYLYTLQQTLDGGYILGGASESGIGGDKTGASKGTFDFWVVKLDASGNKVWDKTFGGSASDDLSALQQTTDGGYILGGTSESGIGGDKTQASRGATDFWIIKLDGSGNKVWDKTFGGAASDDLSALQQTSDGGFILGGSSRSDTGGDKSQPSHGNVSHPDYWVVKVDASGTKVWDKTYGGAEPEFLNSIQQTSNGGYILGGNSESGISGDKTENSKGIVDFWVVRISTTGSVLWDKTIGGNLVDQLYSVRQTSDGGFILGGASDSGVGQDKSQPSKGDMDYWLVKLNLAGTKVWDKTFGGHTHDILFSLQQTSDSGFILGGLSASTISGDKTQALRGSWDYWVIKTGANATGLFEETFNAGLSVFPNPNNGKFTIQLKELTSPTAEVTITDLPGRTILHKKIKFSDNQRIVEVSIPDAKGMFLLHVKTGNQTATRKIIVE
jgi:hypothetical protein